jgi:hypothetical protein
MKFAGGFAAMAALGGRAAAASNARETIETAMPNYFESLGYRRRSPASLITGDRFNGGLRYDEESTEAPPAGKTCVVQDCGRIGDISQRDRPGVLAYFQILSCRNDRPASHGEMMTTVLDALLGPGGLDRDRLVLVSTEAIDPYRPYLDRYGIGPERIVVRALAEAQATGDGDGFFAPRGHPYTSGYPTAGIHYALPSTAPATRLRYPLDGYLELGEVGLEPAWGATISPQSMGLGMERIAMAQGRPVPGFEASRLMLLARLEDEALRRKVDLPEAHAAFSGS